MNHEFLASLRRPLHVALLPFFATASLRADEIVVLPGQSIQAAIDAADPGDTITITSSATPYVENVVWSARDLTIRGSDPGAPPTLAPLDRTRAVLECSSLSSASELRDVQLVADGSTGSGYESALVLTGADLEVNALRVAGFHESRGLGGGALRCVDSDPTLSSSTFEQNVSTSDGGAIWAAGGLVTLNACTFEGNTARSGGAVALVQRAWDIVEDEELVATDCAFLGNTSTAQKSSSAGGGALFASGWYLSAVQTFFAVRATLTGCTFEGNESRSSGGALFLRACQTSIAQCVLRENESTHGNGGGLYASGRPIALLDSELAANRASVPLTGCGGIGTGCGGGIALLADQPDDGDPGFGPIEIAGCIVSDNQALFGGGLCIGKLGIENASLKMSAIDVRDNLVERNVAAFTGGGLQRLTHVGDESAQSHRIRGNTIRDNSADPLLPYGFGGRSLGGGGLFLYGSQVELVVEDNEIAGNSTTGSGGGILTEDNNALIRSNFVHDNAAVSTTSPEDFEEICGECASTYSCADGGAWHDLARFLAARGGGISSTGSGGVTLVGNRLLRNEASGAGLGAGGAIDVRAQPTDNIDYRGNLIAENSASHEGGGVQVEYWPYTWLEEPLPLPDATVAVVQNTLVANSSDGSGGGIYVAAEVDAGAVSGNIVVCNVAASAGGGIAAPLGATITPARYAYNNLYGNQALGADDQWGGAFDPLTQGLYGNTGFDPRFTGYAGCGNPVGDDACAFRLGNASQCRHRADPQPADRNCDGTRGDQGMFGGPALCDDPPCSIPWVLGLQWGTEAGCQITFEWQTAQSTTCTLGYRIGTSGPYTWLPATMGTSHEVSFSYADSAHYDVKIVSSLPLDGLAREKQVNFSYPCYSGGQ